MELQRAAGVAHGVRPGLWSRFAHAERPIQIAIGIGMMSALLLLAACEADEPVLAGIPDEPILAPPPPAEALIITG